MKREDRVVEALHRMVGRGEYQVGDRLPAERRLAASLETSRHTLRAAIRQLAALGFLEVRRGSGCYVCAKPIHRHPPGRDAKSRKGRKLAQRLEASFLLTPVICAVAAERASREDAQALANVLTLVSKAVMAGRPADIPATLRAFSAQLAQCTRNPLLAETVRQLDVANDLFSQDSAPLTGTERESLFAGLVEIVNAVKAGDPKLTAARVRQHILRISRRIARDCTLALPEAIEAAMTELPD